MMKKNKLYGALMGDMMGYPYEFRHKGEIIPVLHDPRGKITDDSVLTLATAAAIMNEGSYRDYYKMFYNFNWTKGWGKRFVDWVNSDNDDLGDSYGNGCLMRLSPIMYLPEWKQLPHIGASCLTTHNHIDSLTACIKLHSLYHRPFTSNAPNKDPEPFDHFEVKALPTINFVEKVIASSSSTREAIMKAIACGGDTDTNASIVGELANYHFQDLTQEDIDYVESRLNKQQLQILRDFNK